MGSYVPGSKEEQQQMLEFLGFSTMEELFHNIPESVKLKENLNIPAGKSELEVKKAIKAMAGKNRVFETIFRGAGSYNHYIPSVVKSITAKERFLTAYTPYQPEISQGVLQAIFEYQSIICELTGMDASNASVYDGASAAAESAAMCCDAKKNKVVISAASKPDTIETVKTYCKAAGRQVVIVSAKDGVTDVAELKANLEGAACFYAEMPNYFGIVEDYESLSNIAHEAGAKFIMGTNPMALSIYKTPAEFGADIAVGEAQGLGMPMSFGGPYLGYMACKADMTRKLPGRIVGRSVDHEGRAAFVLTLQAREQHIRRDKASSNICSNQALCALTAVAYVGAMGSLGMENVADQCYSKAHYAAEEIGKIKGFELEFNNEFFNEFVTNCPVESQKLLDKLEENGILGGLPVDGGILWCVTEMNTKEDIDRLCALLREVA